MRLALFILSLIFVSMGYASPLDVKSQFICQTVVNQKPYIYTDHFSDSFVKALPEAYFNNMIKEVSEAIGGCAKVEMIEDKGNTGIYKFISVSNRYVSLSLYINDDQYITGLQVSEVAFPDVVLDSWSGIESYAGQFDGDVSVTISVFDELSKSTKGSVSQPVGSAFKLYILGALADSIRLNENKWSDELPIRDKFKSLPSGIMQTWPAGEMVSLKTYAEHMIKISDNTATDHLLSHLGRKYVETQLVTMKNDQPNRNIPFLSTAEMFKLKWAAPKNVLQEYLISDVAKKRKILRNKVKDTPLSDYGTNGVDVSSPSFIDEVEWFVSTEALCLAMKSLKNKKSQEVFDILSANTPFIEKGTSSTWSYAGFKGGSEPGVMNMTYLMQNQNGKWGCVAVTFKNTKAVQNQWKNFDFIKKVLTYSEKLY